MHHVTVQRARELLGSQADSLSDSRLDKALDSLHTIVQLIVGGGPPSNRPSYTAAYPASSRYMAPPSGIISNTLAELSRLVKGIADLIQAA